MTRRSLAIVPLAIVLLLGGCCTPRVEEAWTPDDRATVASLLLEDVVVDADARALAAADASARQALLGSVGPILDARQRGGAAADLVARIPDGLRTRAAQRGSGLDWHDYALGSTPVDGMAWPPGRLDPVAIGIARWLGTGDPRRGRAALRAALAAIEAGATPAVAALGLGPGDLLGRDWDRLRAAARRAETAWDTFDVIEARARLTAKRADPPASIGSEAPERIALRERLAREYLELELATDERRIAPGHGGGRPIGGAAAIERRAWIVLGGPAAGKSTVIERLAAATRSLVVGSDVAKAKLPEFDGGVGAGLLLEESSAIAARAVELARHEGMNVIVETTGRDAASLERRIAAFAAEGYAVTLVLVHVPVEVAARRAIDRFRRVGRFVDPVAILVTIGDRPGVAYDRLRGDPRLVGRIHLETDAPAGEPPRVVEWVTPDGLSPRDLFGPPLADVGSIPRSPALDPGSRRAAARPGGLARVAARRAAPRRPAPRRLGGGATPGRGLDRRSAARGGERRLAARVALRGISMGGAEDDHPPSAGALRRRPGHSRGGVAASDARFVAREGPAAGAGGSRARRAGRPARA